MTTYRIRRLHCLQCNEPRRAKLRIENDVEEEARCFECNGPLMALPTLEAPTVPPLVITVGVDASEFISAIEELKSFFSDVFMNLPPEDSATD